MPLPDLPAEMRDEFETVEAVWNTPATTRALDVFILTWVKYEKQARKLLTTLVFHAIGEDAAEREAVRRAIHANTRLKPDGCLRGVMEFAHAASVADLVGERYAALEPRIARIQQRYRNKLLHGQLTSEKLNDVQLDRHTSEVIEWMMALAEVGMLRFGCHGFERNTELLGCELQQDLRPHPFDTAAQFATWLGTLTRR